MRFAQKASPDTELLELEDELDTNALEDELEDDKLLDEVAALDDGVITTGVDEPPPPPPPPQALRPKEIHKKPNSLAERIIHSR